MIAQNHYFLLYSYPGIHTYLKVYIHTQVHMHTQREYSYSVMVIILGNGHGKPSSKPGWGLLAFHIALIFVEKDMNSTNLPPAMNT